MLTNAHVIGDATQLSVVLWNGRERPAELVGLDPYADLALLRVNDPSLQPITWGDSSRLRVAEWVMAVGNPYQLGETVTLGIVSALGRTNSQISVVADYIQTDAAINPGNSGGALVNRRGELIGINTWIFSESGGYQGIGFAVPSNLARDVAAQLEKFGKVRRGTIAGIVRIAPLNPGLAQDLNVVSLDGVVVYRIRNTRRCLGRRPARGGRDHRVQRRRDQGHRYVRALDAHGAGGVGRHAPGAARPRGVRHQGPDQRGTAAHRSLGPALTRGQGRPCHRRRLEARATPSPTSESS